MTGLGARDCLLPTGRALASSLAYPAQQTGMGKGGAQGGSVPRGEVWRLVTARRRPLSVLLCG